MLACEYVCTHVCVSLFISSPSARKTLGTGLEYGIITLPSKAWTTGASVRASLLPLEGHSVRPLEGHSLQHLEGHYVRPLEGHSVRPLEGHSVRPLEEATLRAVILATFFWAFTIALPEITH